MVEITFTYDFVNGMDEKAYARLAKRVTEKMLSAPGFIEFRAHRSLVGTPHVRRTSVWQSLADWATLAEDLEFQELTDEFRTYVTNTDVQMWGPSPLVPHPIRP